MSRLTFHLLIRFIRGSSGEIQFDLLTVIRFARYLASTFGTRRHVDESVVRKVRRGEERREEKEKFLTFEPEFWQQVQRENLR